MLCITILVAFVIMLGPIAQPLTYHAFTDQRRFLGISNFANVISNLPFIAVGFLGLYQLFISKKLFTIAALKFTYGFLFLAVMLIGFGSSYYHLIPNNQTLVWDRLPMTIAFIALFCLIVGEYVAIKYAQRILYPLLVLGCASVFYWQFTESNSVGDLRFYLLVQFLPLILIPLILLFFNGRYSHGKRYWWLLCFYVLAKLLEYFDGEIYSALHIISGHSLKHLFAALGIWLLLQGYQKRTLHKR